MGMILVGISILFILIEKVVLSNLGLTQVNLVLILWVVVVYNLLSRGDKKEKNLDLVFIIFLSGILFDFLAAETIGLHSLLFMVSICWVVLLIRKIPFQNFLLLFPLSVFLASASHNVLLYIFYIAKGVNISFALTDFIFKSIVLDLSFGLLFYPLLSLFLKKINLKREIELKA